MLKDNRREFTLDHVKDCGRIEDWPQTGEIPFVKILEDTYIGEDYQKGLYQFAHLSFQGGYDMMKMIFGAS